MSQEPPMQAHFLTPTWLRAWLQPVCAVAALVFVVGRVALGGRQTLLLAAVMATLVGRCDRHRPGPDTAAQSPVKTPGMARVYFRMSPIHRYLTST